MQTHKLFGQIDISLLTPFPDSINIQSVVSSIEEEVPKYLFSEVDVIYVGNFDFLTKQFRTSKFMENAIYLSDTIATDEDILYNIVKSVSDSLEEKNTHFIFENFEAAEEINIDEIEKLIIESPYDGKKPHKDITSLEEFY